MPVWGGKVHAVHALLAVSFQLSAKARDRRALPGEVRFVGNRYHVPRAQGAGPGGLFRAKFDLREIGIMSPDPLYGQSDTANLVMLWLTERMGWQGLFPAWC